MREIGQDIRQVSFKQFGLLYHRGKAAVRGPEIPMLPETFCLNRIWMIPHFAQRLFQRPGAGSLQVVVLNPK